MDRREFLLSTAALAAGTALEVPALSQQTQPEHPMAPPVAARPAAAPVFEPFTWEAAGLVFSFEFLDHRLRFRHLLPAGAAAPANLPAPNDVSGLETAIHCTGFDVPDHHGAKFTGAYPGIDIMFQGKREVATAQGKRLVLNHTFATHDNATKLDVSSSYQSFGDDIPVVRRTTRLTNRGPAPVGIEYLSSAMLANFASPDTFQDDLRLHFAFNSWQAEAQWRSVRLADAGLVQNGNCTVSGALFTTTGSWPCETYLPMMMLENTRTGVTWFWQIEHNGSWHCQIAQTSARALYAYLGGPDAEHHQAWKNLAPGETYETIPVAVGCVRGGFDEAVAALTRYRRVTHLHPRADMRDCPVVFNDVVMIQGDQTSAAELPLIDAAAALSCEVYCLDVGWYAPPGENWWFSVGDWEPNPARFPGGFKQVTDHIRSKGMVPGLWIEPEVAGFGTALSRRPDSWFFIRHGRRIFDHTRYQLDFRNPDVRAYVDSVFDRLIRDYGIGYIKLDYNINAGEGTDLDTESFGQGLLAHNRAFLAWLDALLDRHPALTLETVASGSMRMEHSMLSRCQLQSISDQDDYRRYASLTTGSSAALLPEQMGVWSQPLANATPAAAACNMVNAMLGRIHQSGYVTRISPEAFAQIRNGIAVYKEHIRRHIPQAAPFYPLGLPDVTRPGEPAGLGMRSPDQTFIAVWRRNGPAEVHIPGPFASARLLYPSDLGIRSRAESNGVAVTLPEENMGCILTI